ncbi:hypothetical protein QQP08_012286, partial [Theobroma cacao]
NQPFSEVPESNSSEDLATIWVIKEGDMGQSQQCLHYLPPSGLAYVKTPSWLAKKQQLQMFHASVRMLQLEYA